MGPNYGEMVLFEKCVRRPRPPTKMAAVTKNRKSLKNDLLWNYWASWAQSMVEWSLGGHLSELCPTTLTTVTKNRKFSKKSLKNDLLWNCWANWTQTMVEWSLGDPLSEVCPTTRLPAKMSAITKNRKFGKKSLKNDLLWNRWVKWAQTMVEWSSDGPLWEMCPTTPVANQDGRCY